MDPFLTSQPSKLGLDAVILIEISIWNREEKCGWIKNSFTYSAFWLTFVMLKMIVIGRVLRIGC